MKSFHCFLFGSITKTDIGKFSNVLPFSFDNDYVHTIYQAKDIEEEVTFVAEKICYFFVIIFTICLDFFERIM